MLAVQQSLGCATTVPAATAAHVFVCDTASLKGRHGILADCRKSRFGGEYQPKFSSSVATTHHCF